MLELGENLKPKTTFTAIIYGMPGTGKTTLGLSCENPVLIDCDDGVERVEYPFRASIPILKPKNFVEIMDIVVNHIEPYKTVVIDTIGSLVDYMMEQVMTDDPRQFRQRDGSPTLKAYGAIKAPFKALLSSIKSQGKSVLFIGHADEKDNGGLMTYRIQCAGSTANLLIGMVDFVGFCDMMGNQRTITFSPTERAIAKNSLGLPENIKIPNTATAGNVFMQKEIGSAIAKRANESSEIQAQFDALISKMTCNVANCKTAADLLAVWEWSKGLAHIWESKVRFSDMLKKRAADLQIVFDKDTGKFIMQSEKFDKDAG